MVDLLVELCRGHRYLDLYELSLVTTVDCIQTARLTFEKGVSCVVFRYATYVGPLFDSGHERLFANASSRVVATSVCKIVFWSQISTTGDPIFDVWPVKICPQAVQFLGIVSACILHLKMLFKSLQSGFTRGDSLSRPHNSIAYGYGSYDLSFTRQ